MELISLSKDDAINLAVLWVRAYDKMNQMQQEDVPAEFERLISYLGSFGWLIEGLKQ